MTKRILAIAGLALMSGCATQSEVYYTTAPAEAKPADAFVTGSRLPVKDATSTIGVRTLDKDETNRMLRSRTGS